MVKKGGSIPKNINESKVKQTQKNLQQALVLDVEGIIVIEAANALQEMLFAKLVEKNSISQQSVCQQKGKYQEYQA